MAAGENKARIRRCVDEAFNAGNLAVVDQTYAAAPSPTRPVCLQSHIAPRRSGNSSRCTGVPFPTSAPASTT
jgi:hypothetical protein